MSPEVVIRAYTAVDRDAVRTIACETADRGEPMEHFFPDRVVFADLLTSYYTEYDSRALWVAVHDGRVIGYLTGCLDSRHYGRVMTWRVIPQAVWKALAHGLLLSAQAWRSAGAGLRTWWGGELRRQISFEDYPAHLHVNVQQGFRGQQIGRRLVERFLEQARSAGASGVHAAVRGDNEAACRFFARVGFTELYRHHIVFPLDASHESLIYGKRLT